MASMLWVQVASALTLFNLVAKLLPSESNLAMQENVSILVKEEQDKYGYQGKVVGTKFGHLHHIRQ